MAKDIDDLFGLEPEKTDSPTPTEQSVTPRRSKREVPLVVSLLTFFGMFVAAAATISPDPRALEMAYLFPLGLIAGIGSLIGPMQQHAKNGADGQAVGQALMWIAYAIYVGFFIIFCRIHKWKWFGLACVILFCLLLLNVSGCQKMLNGLHGIM